MSETSIIKDGNAIQINLLTEAECFVAMADPANGSLMGELIQHLKALNLVKEAKAKDELDKLNQEKDVLTRQANAKEILGFPGIVQVPALQDPQFAYSGPLHEIKFKNAGEVFNFFSKYESLLYEEGTSVTVSFRGRKLADGIQTGVKAGKSSVFSNPFKDKLYEVVDSTSIDNSVRKITVRR